MKFTSSGHGSPAVTLTIADGHVQRGEIQWRASCSSGTSFPTSTRIKLRKTRVGRMRLKSRQDAHSKGIFFRFRTQMRGREVKRAPQANGDAPPVRAVSTWAGTFRVTFTVFRDGRLIDRCHSVGRRWKATGLVPIPPTPPAPPGTGTVTYQYDTDFDPPGPVMTVQAPPATATATGSPASVTVTIGDITLTLRAGTSQPLAPGNYDITSPTDPSQMGANFDEGCFFSPAHVGIASIVFGPGGRLDFLETAFTIRCLNSTVTGRLAFNRGR